MARLLTDRAIGWTGLPHITREVAITLACIAAVLVFASIMVRVLKRLHPNRNDVELRLRVRTWWVIAWTFGLAILLSRGTSVTYLAFVSFLALREYLSLIPIRQSDRRVLFWAYLSIPMQYYWAYSGWYEMFVVFIPVYMFLLIPARMVSIGNTDGFLQAIGTLHWGLMMTVFSLSHTAMLLMFHVGDSPRVTPHWSSPIQTTSPGVALLVLLVLLTEFNDVAQYIWGKSLGRVRVVPTVSPGKTLGGLLGGIGSTIVLAALLGPWLTILDFTRSIIAGSIIAMSGFAGDVSISAVKRDLRIKDSGTILPGHGGILDRLDSLTYTAPLFFHFIYYCYG